MKRGVSSLIATVLLISFGVMLAIFIMNWGFDFFKSSQRDVERQSKEKFSCTTDVVFEVRCNCSKLGSDIDKCTFKIINNEDSIVKSISYRLFRGEKYLKSDIPDPGPLGTNGLEAWGVSDYFLIDSIPSSGGTDNVKLEVLAIEIESGGTTIKCGSIASNIATCKIEP